MRIISQLNSILIFRIFYGQIAIYDGKNLRSMIFEWNMFKEFVGIDSMLSVE